MRLAGRPHEALEALGIASDERRGPPAPPLVARRLARAEVLAHLAAGNADRPRRYPGAPSSAAPVAARLELACGRPEVALELAEGHLAAGKEPGRRRERIEAFAIAALAHAAMDDDRGAAARLGDALRSAAPLGWLAPFAELGDAAAVT